MKYSRIVVTLSLLFFISETTAVENGSSPSTQQKNIRRELRASALDGCLHLLNEVADSNGKVGAEEYVSFLRLISDDTLSFESFQDLPLPLIMLFYGVSCSAGRDCVSVEPGLLLNQPNGTSLDFLHFFCSQIDSYLPLQVVVRFQYLLLFNEDDILGEDDLDDFAPALETASRNVLLTAFYCINRMAQPNSNLDSTPARSYRTQSYPVAARQPRLRRIPKPATNIYDNRLARGSDHDCAFDIAAHVDDFSPIACPPDLGGNFDQCALVSSRVVVVILSEDEPPDQGVLREMIVGFLREAIDGDQFESFLVSPQ